MQRKSSAELQIDDGADKIKAGAKAFRRKMTDLTDLETGYSA